MTDPDKRAEAVADICHTASQIRALQSQYPKLTEDQIDIMSVFIITRAQEAVVRLGGRVCGIKKNSAQGYYICGRPLGIHYPGLLYCDCIGREGQVTYESTIAVEDLKAANEAIRNA